MEELMNVPEEDEIPHLYSLIRQNPDLLTAIDNHQFADTPLHLAAGQGRTQLALEILRLMPSFGRKLNPDGFCPLHLALRRGHTETVTAMVKLDPQLVRVQGREGISPLHYVAEMDEVDFLAEFLLICPDSIEELTIRGESAVHVAVRSEKVAAFRVLLGWLKRTGRREVLGWRDWKGNTVLHLAALTNQTKMIKLLVKEVSVNNKNSKGLTALDIAMELPPHVNGTALQILQWHHAKSGSCFPHHPRLSTFAEYLSSPVTIIERIIKLGAYLNFSLPAQIRDSILVVAVLVATATFQAALSPPGGFSNQNPTPNYDTGKVMMPRNDFLTFTALNSIALAASLGMIFLVLPTSRSNILLHLSLLFMMLSYTVAIKVTSPPNMKATVISVVSYAVFTVIISIKVFVPRMENVSALRRLVGSKHFYNISEVLGHVCHNKYLSSSLLGNAE